MRTRIALIDQLKAYSPTYEAEALFKDQFLELLQHQRCFHRDHLPGHITGSAFIINESNSRVLLTHHAKLNRWLQPGGHADGEEDVLHVAQKEAREETGLAEFKILTPDSIFDIDIHTIPERKGFPQHLHFDVRILLQASQDEKLVITDESHDLKWIPFTDLLEKTGNNESIMRMASKATHLLRPNE
jgi:8-oxo-dGTP pyrophosphatase MutT (NUDIX family)